MNFAMGLQITCILVACSWSFVPSHSVKQEMTPSKFTGLAESPSIDVKIRAIVCVREVRGVPRLWAVGLVVVCCWVLSDWRLWKKWPP